MTKKKLPADISPLMSEDDFLHLIPEVPTVENVLNESGSPAGIGAREVLTRKVKAFKWTKKTEKAAISLALGYTVVEVAEMVKVTDRTIRRWKKHPEFTEEVDYLSNMVGIASRAERLRIVQMIIRKYLTTRSTVTMTEKDLLEWLKYAQSETDGIKLDLAALAEAQNTLAGS